MKGISRLWMLIIVLIVVVAIALVVFGKSLGLPVPAIFG